MRCFFPFATDHLFPDNNFKKFSFVCLLVCFLKHANPQFPLLGTVAHPGMQRQTDLYESEASMVYRVRQSRLHRDPVSGNKNKNKTECPINPGAGV